ncbi:GAF domain-containing protein [Nesterenkonia sp. MY13]|uniref:GAF domain-containing protein n=1 Tax=Nesterenkonia sedimenti TaxID=1463632 RepID=A0A7X8YCP6_9MICC|nr:GAF domain-containing protein [Nesterenkonia sedimenti]NLS08650.1 GAF domain-containing protein [Nesterenkonia sedimenti]
MKAVPDDPQTWSALRPALRESWHRSAQFLRDPGSALAPVEMDDSDLGAYRREHPLRQVLPIFEKLLVQPAADAGLVVAIGDAEGRLLWVDGDRRALRLAEGSAFQPGATWSEEAIGTSAPGVALITGQGVQVHQEEHFASSAHQFSCSAAPICNPHTGGLLGVVDLTGGEMAVATHSLPLIQAAISAAEAELKVLPADTGLAQLTTLGTRRPQIGIAAARESLSLRHAEILTLLAWDGSTSGRGHSAGELAELIFGEPGHEVTLRAEIVRLRRILRSTPAAAGMDLESRPYRLSSPLDLDALTVVTALTAGDRSTALDIYGGALLPNSEAPGIMELRQHISAALREALLSDGTPEELLRYLQLSEAARDEQVVYTALRLLPPDSPQRAALVARMQP